jgi:excisionase family DNA binding protein
MIDQPLYDLPDVSRMLGNCSRSTLYRLIEQGKLVRVRLGSKALITGKSLAAYVDELSATPVLPTSQRSIAGNSLTQQGT